MHRKCHLSLLTSELEQTLQRLRYGYKLMAEQKKIICNNPVLFLLIIYFTTNLNKAVKKVIILQY